MNLTPIPLSDHIKSLLAFGLKFCPTPADNKHTTMVLNQKLPDFALAAKREFYFRSKKEQRLRRNPHLANNPRRDVEERERTGFKLPSDFCPADHQIADPVTRALESIETSLTDPLLEPLTHNITEAQQEALRQLTFNRDNIIIRKADKGSATVLQTRTNYVREIHRQLNNPEYYIPTETNHTPGTIEALSAVYTQLEGIRGEIGKFSPTGYCGLSKQQIEYFSPWTHRELRDRIAYGLPKIHKAPAKWPIPYRSPPSRPIISSCGCVTSEISELVDYILNPIAVTYEGYIKNTQHFVDIVRSLDVPQDATLLTSDVNGMYTNLPVRGILAATRQALADHPPTQERPRIPDELLLDIMEICLERNDFVFSESRYLQIKGVAMGNIFAPAVANIYMANWEKTHLPNAPLQPLAWYRYLDDVFNVWTHSKESLNEFQEFICTRDPNIKFECEPHDSEVNFLDTTVFKGPDITDNKLSVKLYRKPTDTMELLHRESYHPPHVFRGIVKSQILRYRRICTHMEDFEQACTSLFKALTPRGYSVTDLRRTKREVLQSLANEPGRPGPGPPGQGRPAPHTPHAVNPGPITPTPQANDPNYALFLGYISESGQTGSSRPCGSRRCQACPHITETERFRSTKTGASYPLTYHLTCASKGVIYLITCAHCQYQYVGETSTPFRDRLNHYRHRISTYYLDTTLVEAHFKQPDHNGMNDLEVTLICRARTVFSDPALQTGYRRHLEAFFIKALRTESPLGLNARAPKDPRILPLKVPYTEGLLTWARSQTRLWNTTTGPLNRNLLPGRALVAVCKQKSLRDSLSRSTLKNPWHATVLMNALPDGTYESIRYLFRDSVLPPMPEIPGPDQGTNQTPEEPSTSQLARILTDLQQDQPPDDLRPEDPRSPQNPGGSTSSQ